MIRLYFILLAALALTVPSDAADVTAGALKISAPWARATPKGATVGGGYMTITNSGQTADRLLGGTTPVADRVQIHQMSMDGGIMKMRAVDSGLDIKPGQTVRFEPGGYHVMFVGLKSSLTQGQTFKVTLQFEKAGAVEVDYPVGAIGAQSLGGGDAPLPMGGMKH